MSSYRGDRRPRTPEESGGYWQRLFGTSDNRTLAEVDEDRAQAKKIRTLQRIGRALIRNDKRGWSKHEIEQGHRD